MERFDGIQAKGVKRDRGGRGEMDLCLPRVKSSVKKDIFTFHGRGWGFRIQRKEGRKRLHFWEGDGEGVGPEHALLEVYICID